MQSMCWRLVVLSISIVSGLAKAGSPPTAEERPAADLRVIAKQREERRREAEAAEVQELSGKEVVVRVYSDWDQERTTCVLVKAELREREIVLDYGKFAAEATFVVLGQDQNDAAVRAFVGSRGICWRNKERLRPELPRQVWCEPLTFVDALGDPLQLATVRVDDLKNMRRAAKGPEFVTDEEGRLDRVAEQPPSRQQAIIVSHPEYDGPIGICRMDNAWPCEVLAVGFVPRGTDVAERAVRGFVIDEANQPIANAIVSCGTIVPPDGTPRYGFGCAASTDDKGWFRVYFAEGDGKGPFVPPATAYVLDVDARDERGLAVISYSGRNNAEQTIKLTQKAYFHRFRFEDEDGLVTDTDKLELTTILIRREGPPVTYTYDEVREGGQFPSGTYEAWRGSSSGYKKKIEPCKFEPITVTEESPELLVFRVKSPGGILYKGTVINGVNQQPLGGAFVMVGNVGDLSIITKEQWKEMHNLPGNPSKDEKALRPLYSALHPFGMPISESVSKLVRTGPDGRFELVLKQSEKPYELIAFEEDYLSTLLSLRESKPDGNNVVELPVTPLFPAAKIVIEPTVQKYEVQSGILPARRMPGEAERRAEKREPNLAPRTINMLANNMGVHLEIEADANGLPAWVGKPPRSDWAMAGQGTDPNDITAEANIAMEEMLSKIDELGRVLLTGNVPVGLEENEPAPADTVVEAAVDDNNRITTFFDCYPYGSGPQIVSSPLSMNERRTYHVPAGFRYRLRFAVTQEEGWCAPEILLEMNPSQGEVVNAGRYVFERAALLKVRVLDVNGAPVEHALVEAVGERISQGRLGTFTDESGLAIVYVRPKSKGMLCICIPGTAEEVPYRTDEETGAGKELVVSIGVERRKQEQQNGNMNR